MPSRRKSVTPPPPPKPQPQHSQQRHSIVPLGIYGDGGGDDDASAPVVPEENVAVAATGDDARALDDIDVAQVTTGARPQARRSAMRVAFTPVYPPPPLPSAL